MYCDFCIDWKFLIMMVFIKFWIIILLYVFGLIVIVFWIEGYVNDV